MNCFKKVEKENSPCCKKKCRYFINFDEDLNCIFCSIDKYGELSYKQISERMGISMSNISAIAKNALEKIKKGVDNSF